MNSDATAMDKLIDMPVAKPPTPAPSAPAASSAGGVLAYDYTPPNGNYYLFEREEVRNAVSRIVKDQGHVDIYEKNSRLPNNEVEKVVGAGVEWRVKLTFNKAAPFVEHEVIRRMIRKREPLPGGNPNQGLYPREYALYKKLLQISSLTPVPKNVYPFIFLKAGTDFLGGDPTDGGSVFWDWDLMFRGYTNPSKSGKRLLTLSFTHLAMICDVLALVSYGINPRLGPQSAREVRVMQNVLTYDWVKANMPPQRIMDARKDMHATAAYIIEEMWKRGLKLTPDTTAAEIDAVVA